MTVDALKLGIGELAAAYAEGSLSPMTVVTQLLDAIAADARGINALCWLDRTAALRDTARCK